MVNHYSWSISGSINDVLICVNNQLINQCLLITNYNYSNNQLIIINYINNQLITNQWINDTMVNAWSSWLFIDHHQLLRRIAGDHPIREVTAMGLPQPTKNNKSMDPSLRIVHSRNLYVTWRSWVRPEKQMAPRSEREVKIDWICIGSRIEGSHVSDLCKVSRKTLSENPWFSKKYHLRLLSPWVTFWVQWFSWLARNSNRAPLRSMSWTIAMTQGKPSGSRARSKASINSRRCTWSAKLSSTARRGLGESTHGSQQEINRV